jgi:hypothetical protein
MLMRTPHRPSRRCLTVSRQTRMLCAPGEASPPGTHSVRGARCARAEGVGRRAAGRLSAYLLLQPAPLVSAVCEGTRVAWVERLCWHRGVRWLRRHGVRGLWRWGACIRIQRSRNSRKRWLRRWLRERERRRARDRNVIAIAQARRPRSGPWQRCGCVWRAHRRRVQRGCSGVDGGRPRRAAGQHGARYNHWFRGGARVEGRCW